MSGHSKWAGIKHKKALIDAKKGKMFSKIVREITIAARLGGGDPSSNSRLRLAMEKAREVNMPQENIKTAVKRGTGEIPGVNYEEVVYEGYGPQGVAVIIIANTDNKNRTTSEIRKIFSTHGGSLGEIGCVNWMFQKKGYITIEKGKVKEDKLMELVLDLGAEDMKTDDEDFYEIITTPEDFERIEKSLREKNIPLSSAEITMLPQTYIKLEGKDAEQMLKLMNALDEHEDVVNVYANFDISKELMEKISSES